jgi:hypothetical protein
MFIAKLEISRDDTLYTFYIIIDTYIPELPTDTITDYTLIKEEFTDLCLEPEKNSSMVLTDEPSAGYILGSFYDLYLYNLFNSDKVNKFIKT